MVTDHHAVTSRKQPTGLSIFYPICGRWDCDDYDYDWENVDCSDLRYPAVKRERDIAYYHQPRESWQTRLQQERDRRNCGEPLWSRRQFLADLGLL